MCVLGEDGKAVAGGAGLRYRAPADACGAPAEGWPSGLRRTPGKRVHRKVSGVRIPLPPPPYAIGFGWQATTCLT